jgi:hypothetical protein
MATKGLKRAAKLFESEQGAISEPAVLLLEGCLLHRQQSGKKTVTAPKLSYFSFDGSQES